MTTPTTDWTRDRIPVAHQFGPTLDMEHMATLQPKDGLVRFEQLTTQRTFISRSVIFELSGVYLMWCGLWLSLSSGPLRPLLCLVELMHLCSKLRIKLGPELSARTIDTACLGVWMSAVRYLLLDGSRQSVISKDLQ